MREIERQLLEVIVQSLGQENGVVTNGVVHCLFAVPTSKYLRPVQHRRPIDGPDTEENQAVYPQSPSQEEGLGFPILRCVCLISIFTRLLVNLGYAAYSGKGTGETAILRQLRSSLRPGDTLVADSYYCTYWLLAMCLKLGVHVVMKNHHKRDDDPIGAI